MTTDERLEFLLKSTESLHATAQELTTTAQELRATAQLHSEQLEQDGQNIRSLATIAAAHQTRIENLEGGKS